MSKSDALKILVVDDEPDLGELVAFEFELIGAKVRIANSGNEALECAKAESFDAVISDIRMPRGDGIHLLKELRTLHHRNPPLVFMTGYADITLEDSYDLGAAALFGKPFNRKELLSVVRRAITTPQERWSQASESSSSALKLEMTFDSIDSALEQGQLALGVGGLFIAMEEDLPLPSDSVSFQFEFKSGEISAISGSGLVRWVRGKDHGGNTGFGVEVLNYDEKCIEAIVNYIDARKVFAFIPKN